MAAAEHDSAVVGPSGAAGDSSAAADAAWARHSATFDQVVDLWMAGRLGGHQALRCLRVLRTGELADFLALLFGAVFSEAQLETLPRALGMGADPWELLLLGVHGRNCEGEDLTIISPADLLARMAAAVGLSQERPSAWLADYTGLLVDEWERRRADAGAFPRPT